MPSANNRGRAGVNPHTVTVSTYSVTVGAGYWIALLTERTALEDNYCLLRICKLLLISVWNIE